jgi:hypothetical protein
LFCGEGGWHFNMHAHQLVTMTASAQAGHTLALKPEGRSALRADGNFQRGLSAWLR